MDHKKDIIDALKKMKFSAGYIYALCVRTHMEKLIAAIYAGDSQEVAKQRQLLRRAKGLLARARGRMTEADLKKKWEEKSTASVRIRQIIGVQIGPIGVAIKLSENLPPFYSGDIIVFWEEGGHTCLEDVEFEIIEHLF